MSTPYTIAAATLVAVLTTGTLLTAQGRVTASATGSGHVTINGSMRTFAFTVRRDASGTASGQLELNNRDLGLRAHAQLNCLNIIGNTAIISGQITDTNTPAWEDAYIWAKVVDNGEGSKAPADKLTLVYSWSRPSRATSTPACHTWMWKRATFRSGRNFSGH